jgi:hypothetical protein
MVTEHQLPHQEDNKKMQWSRSTAIGLAKTSCTSCHGHGMRKIRKDTEVPCNCVFRAIFRACYNRFRECVAHGSHPSTVSLEFCAGGEGRRVYSRKREEFVADFCLVSQRLLDESEYRLFRYYYVLGADSNLCCRQMQVPRGNLFHHVYRIQQKLGRGFAELEPYALFPLDEYFGGTILREPPRGLFPERRPMASRAPEERLLPLSA